MAMGGGTDVRSDVRQIGRVAVPLYLSMIVVSLSALVNTAALGRFGTVALAAFAVTVALYFPAMAAVSGAVRGVMPFIGSAADDPQRLRRVVRDGSWLSVLVGVLGAGAVAAVPLLAGATGVPEATVQELGSFPLLMAAGVLLNSFGSLATSCLVALGRSTVVMYAGLLGAACTAVLSPLLVNGAGLGLQGAGISLLLANLAIASVTTIGLRRQLGVGARTVLGGRPRLSDLLELARVGIPMAGTVLVKFGVLGVLAFAAALVSTTAAAAHSIATGLVSTTFTAAVAIGQATIPLLSWRAERGERHGVRRAVLAGLITALSTLAVLGIAILLLRDHIVPLFTEDPVVTSAVTGLLVIVVLVILGDGAQAVLGFGLTGMKRSTPSFLVFAVVYGLLALVVVPVARAGGLTGLWVALAVANLLVALGQAVAFRWVWTRLPQAAQPAPD